MPAEGFHPDLQQSGPMARSRVHHVKSSDIDADTTQSAGMQGFAAMIDPPVENETTPLALALIDAGSLSGPAKTALLADSATTPARTPTRPPPPPPDGNGCRGGPRPVLYADDDCGTGGDRATGR